MKPMSFVSIVLVAAVSILLLAQEASSFVVKRNARATGCPGKLVRCAAANGDVAPVIIKPEKLSKEAQELEAILQKKSSGKYHQKIVIQTAPAVRVSLPELYGEPPGTYDVGILVAALKALGFDIVLDTNTAADLTICEEATELLAYINAKQQQQEQERSQQGEMRDTGSLQPSPPLFTSCCPGWLFFLDKSAPEMIANLSSCKSPMMMFGAVIKQNSQALFGLSPNEICSVAVMPCVAKRQESDQPVFCSNDGVRDVDLVITTKELGTLLALHGIDPKKLDPLPFDSPFQQQNSNQPSSSGLGTGAGQLFGATGGVMEASLRSVYEMVTGTRLPRVEFDAVRGFEDLKEATVSLLDKETGRGIDMELKIAVVHGLANAKKLFQKIKQGEVSYDYVEAMACPGGCIGGGGQPRCVDKATREQRLQSIYKLDRSLPIRRSHENPDIIRLYDEILGGKYGSKEAHQQLHVKEQVYGGSTSSS